MNRSFEKLQFHTTNESDVEKPHPKYLLKYQNIYARSIRTKT